MLIIISPSKTQEPTHQHHEEYSIPLFIDKCQILVEELRQLSVEELGQLMKMSNKLSELTRLRLADFIFPPTRQKCSQALLTFQGDVYSAIGADTYSADDFHFAQDHLRILSGLYGILKPLDLIQPYRLEMGTKLKIKKDANLYHFWKEAVTSSVNRTMATMKNPALINLASAEYAKVIDAGKLQAPIINVFFKQLQNGKLRTIAIHAKRARGAMADFIIRNRLHNPSDLSHFSHDGYRFDKQSSTGTELLFIR